MQLSYDRINRMKSEKLISDVIYEGNHEWYVYIVHVNIYKLLKLEKDPLISFDDQKDDVDIHSLTPQNTQEFEWSHRYIVIPVTLAGNNSESSHSVILCVDKYESTWSIFDVNGYTSLVPNVKKVWKDFPEIVDELDDLALMAHQNHLMENDDPK